MVKQWQDLFYDERYSGTVMVNPKFDKLAEGITSKPFSIYVYIYYYYFLKFMYERWIFINVYVYLCVFLLLFLYLI